MLSKLCDGEGDVVTGEIFSYVSLSFILSLINEPSFISDYDKLWESGEREVS